MDFHTTDICISLTFVFFPMKVIKFSWYLFKGKVLIGVGRILFTVTGFIIFYFLNFFSSISACKAAVCSWLYSGFVFFQKHKLLGKLRTLHFSIS